jgi:5'-nucleotidase
MSSYSLSDKLVIGISSRALFDLEHENKIYQSDGTEAYAAYQRANEDQPLKPGTAFPLIKALLELNERFTTAPRRLVWNTTFTIGARSRSMWFPTGRH